MIVRHQLDAAEWFDAWSRGKALDGETAARLRHDLQPALDAWGLLAPALENRSELATLRDAVQQGMTWTAFLLKALMRRADDAPPAGDPRPHQGNLPDVEELTTSVLDLASDALAQWRELGRIAPLAARTLAEWEAWIAEIPGIESRYERWAEIGDELLASTPERGEALRHRLGAAHLSEHLASACARLQETPAAAGLRRGALDRAAVSQGLIAADRLAAALRRIWIPPDRQRLLLVAALVHRASGSPSGAAALVRSIRRAPAGLGPLVAQCRRERVLPGGPRSESVSRDIVLLAAAVRWVEWEEKALEQGRTWDWAREQFGQEMQRGSASTGGIVGTAREAEARELLLCGDDLPRPPAPADVEWFQRRIWETRQRWLDNGTDATRRGALAGPAWLRGNSRRAESESVTAAFVRAARNSKRARRTAGE